MQELNILFLQQKKHLHYFTIKINLIYSFYTINKSWQP